MSGRSMVLRTSGPRRGAEPPWSGEDVPSMLLVSLLTLICFTALFAFRFLDDNRLTSWAWAFDGRNFWAPFAVLAAGVGLAAVLSRAAWDRRGTGLALFAASFAVGALFWREPEVIVDAARYFTQAKSLEVNGIGYFLREWGAGIEAWTDLPLTSFLYGLVLSFAGEARVAVQAFTTALFSGTVVATYLIGCALWDRTTGLYAATLLLATPVLLIQVPLMLADVPTMFFLTLAVLATIHAARRGGTALLAAAGAIALVMLSKYSAWLMLSVVPVVFVAHLDVGRNVAVKRAVAVAAGVIALAGVLVAAKPDIVAQQLALLASYQWPGLGKWQEGHVSTFLFQTHPFVAVAALGSVALAIQRRDSKFTVVAWMMLLIVALGIRRSRYVLVALPMLALMAAYGLARLPNARLGRMIVSCAVVAMLVTAVGVFLPFLRGTSAANLQSAGAYLDESAVERADIYALAQRRSAVNAAVVVPILDLYTKTPLVLRGARATPPPTLATSPVRFTWAYGRRTDPAIPASPRAAVVVILDRADQPLPETLRRRLTGYRLTREFAKTDRAYLFQTLVRVYEPLQTPSTTAPAITWGRGRT